MVGDVVPKRYLLNVNNFNGQLFQWLYIKANSNKSVKELSQMYLSEESQLELNKIYDFVTNNGNKVKC